ncbi:MAG: gamma-glutamyl-gamma-aminobutyrate hydrolase family protein [Deltaproteobacteria bacterium]|nr:gamma-glutamyl-gamma-aminobutyrate hydrolase family protein [Deltaproteobacteria bacterium]
MKTIAITQRLEERPDYQETWECLALEWHRFLNSCGFQVQLISIQHSEEHLNQLIQKSDGVILSGGNAPAVCEDIKVNQDRDNHERRVLNLALQHNKNLMGVCRGAQFLLAEHGSKLANCPNHVRVRHLLKMQNQSQHIGTQNWDREVNSFHAFGCKESSKELCVLAQATDGVIEAFEHRKQRIMGILWHPEREEIFSADDQKLFKDFFGATS